MNCPSAMRLAKTLMQYMNSIRIYNTYTEEYLNTEYK